MITKADLDERHAQTEMFYREVEIFLDRLEKLVIDDKLSADLALEIATMLRRMNNHHRETIKTTLGLLRQHGKAS